MLINSNRNALLNNPNNPLPNRDSTQGMFPIPLNMRAGSRVGVREFIKDTVARGFPLTVKTNTYATKIEFEGQDGIPTATGVHYLEGRYLYRASPLSGDSGTPGFVSASKEVILSAGAYVSGNYMNPVCPLSLIYNLQNTPQLLKLSGVGPKAELESFNITVLKDLPGVGTNMQDRYEIGVNAEHEDEFAILDGCTLDAKPHDKCYTQWKNNPYVLAQRGTYATNGLAATMVAQSDYADDSNVDMFIFGSPANFTGECRS